MLTLLLAWPADAHAFSIREYAESDRGWSQADVGLQAAFTVATVMDVMATHDCLYGNGRSRDCYEQNPVIGPHPSRTRLNALAGSALLGHAIVSVILPRGFWRTAWQLGGLAIEGALATEGLAWGLSYKAPW